MRWVWGGIAAYFFVFWYAVADLGAAVACTFFLVMIGLKATVAAMARSSIDQSQPDQSPLPEAANLNREPR